LYLKSIHGLSQNSVIPKVSGDNGKGRTSCRRRFALPSPYQRRHWLRLARLPMTYPCMSLQFHSLCTLVWRPGAWMVPYGGLLFITTFPRGPCPPTLGGICDPSLSTVSSKVHNSVRLPRSPEEHRRISCYHKPIRVPCRSECMNFQDLLRSRLQYISKD
jgi:hypothetical protein